MGLIFLYFIFNPTFPNKLSYKMYKFLPSSVNLHKQIIFIFLWFFRLLMNNVDKEGQGSYACLVIDHSDQEGAVGVCEDTRAWGSFSGCDRTR